MTTDDAAMIDELTNALNLFRERERPCLLATQTADNWIDLGFAREKVYALLWHASAIDRLLALARRAVELEGAIAAERERCAKIAETMPAAWDFHDYLKAVTFADIAAAIRGDA